MTIITSFNIFKKLIIVVISVALWSACNQRSDKSGLKDNTNIQETKTALTLNSKVKWQADSGTNHHVADLQTIASRFKIQPTPSVEEYHILGNDLGNSLNKMIRDCKMTGPDHEALHKWIGPLFNEISQLKNITDTTAARKTFNLIDRQLGDYHNYFK